ncbi:MAG: four helix bundle protein, partial [Flavobacteriaceae bacterium]|nr:four helix bundle protein [Flavobacteriaceae bacterium]
MATIKRFEDLEIWQDARKLSKEIIQVSVTTDLKNDYKLKDQIRSS